MKTVGQGALGARAHNLIGDRRTHRSLPAIDLHGVEERLARWLLMSQDRIDSDILPLTHEFLAQMLGTRCASVSVAGEILQQAGLNSLQPGSCLDCQSRSTGKSLL